MSFKSIHPNHFWYAHKSHPISLSLLPFSWLFSGGVSMRQWLYRSGLYKTKQMSVPVIVVGNITVGGTGKTPFVIWLANFLQAQGYHPGIVSRGVGGRKHRNPIAVQRMDDYKMVGDEALVLRNKTQCPVVIGIDRVAAAEYLLEKTFCDIIISDDGLQHYRLGRDIEIMMVDPLRQFGNKRMLPAGPLREKPYRMQTVDFVIANNAELEFGDTMHVQPVSLINLVNQTQYTLESFPHKTVHAVAGLGNPERFFNMLRSAEFELLAHRFPDHHHYCETDFNFADNHPIVMTYKDAVKCDYANERYWYLDIAVSMNEGFEKQLMAKLRVN